MSKMTISDFYDQLLSDKEFQEPETGMVRGFLTVPNPFECDITPRSAQHARVIRESFGAAEDSGEFQ